MALVFQKDGQSIECDAIYGGGRIGQLVVLDHVSYGPNPNPAKYPLSPYTLASVFTITQKVEGKDGYYVVMDTNGTLIKLHDENYGASERHLYDAAEWIAWTASYTSEKLRRKDQAIANLTSQRDLMKSILIEQGIRVVTPAQAEAMGLNNK